MSPTQTHQSNGAVEKAVSTVRGLARTNLAVLKDKKTVLPRDDTRTDAAVDNQARSVCSGTIQREKFNV